MARFRWLVGLLALAVLAGCAPKRSVVVEPSRGGESPRPAPVAQPGEYLVVRGDTLYGIAFRHGMDYRELAERNGIAAPFTIYPGQRLRIAAPATSRVASVSAPTTPRRSDRALARSGVIAPIARDPAPSAPPAATAGPSTAGVGAGPSGAASIERPDSAPSSVAAAPTGTAAGDASASPSTPSAPSAPVAQTPTAAPAAPATPVSLPKGDPRWQWPASGQVIATFLAGDPTRQGINLAGSAGDPVKAAADGVVVYSGSGLIGYGELIIVKHNETWLSAYGHNRRRLVAEGAAVKGGQVIAEMGRSGASRDMLHFEVRKGGRSVNPIGVLPRR